MITHAFKLIHRALVYTKDHPQILFSLVLLLVIPFLFWFTGDQYLQVSKQNQDRLENDRIGLLHDIFVSLVGISGVENLDPVSEEIHKIAALNPDVVAFRLVVRTDDGFVPLVALNEEVLETLDSPEPYLLSYTTENESIISLLRVNDVRYIQGVRRFKIQNSDYFLLTVTSRESVDNLFANREQKALLYLFFVYLLMGTLAYWHIKLTDYRYLYITAKNANDMKDLFTNMIAHELRAPLTAIRGYASMIEEKTTGQEKEYSTRVRESSERLLAIVNDLLDVARIQSGKLKIEKTGTDISPVITNVLNELRISGTEKNIELTSEGADTSRVCMVDEKRLHQALTNLVSNAIKYTPEGNIVVAVEDKRKVIEIRVKDSGMGISSSDQKKLFAPFFRVANDDVSKITGTGLGMWITKQLIELMGGTINVESIKGVGTHVVIAFQKQPVH